MLFEPTKKNSGDQRNMGRLLFTGFNNLQDTTEISSQFSRYHLLTKPCLLILPFFLVYFLYKLLVTACCRLSLQGTDCLPLVIHWSPQKRNCYCFAHICIWIWEFLFIQTLSYLYSFSTWGPSLARLSSAFPTWSCKMTEIARSIKGKISWYWKSIRIPKIYLCPKYWLQFYHDRQVKRIK